MNTEETNNMIDIDIQTKIKEAQDYRQKIITKTMEAQERVDRLTIMMYHRFINETEGLDN